MIPRSSPPAPAPEGWDFCVPGMGLTPHRACTCSGGVEHGSTPCEQVLRGCGALLHIARARAPRVWNSAPHRASRCSEAVEQCSTPCEHCSEGVEHCSTSCEHGYNLTARRNLPAGSFVLLTRSRRSRDFRLRRLSAVRTCWIAHQIRTVAGVELCSSCRGHSGCACTPRENINRRCRRVAGTSSRWPPRTCRRVVTSPPA